MSEDSRTLWVGNLDEKVTEPLMYELFLQTGPIERLIFVTEGDGENKKHTGQAFVVFKHSESVQYACQVELFDSVLNLNTTALLQGWWLQHCITGLGKASDFSTVVLG
ncbi:hypothetical protein BsWGS_11814 [Bradybaena similaris]